MENPPTLFSKISYAKILITVIILLIFSSPLIYNFAMEQKPPKRRDMRNHIVSKLSEDQIREIYARAKDQFNKIKKYSKEKDEKFWRKKSVELAKCRTDVAYRTKNPEACKLPILYKQIGKAPQGYTSVEMIFERELMGICDYLTTIREAKKYGCLPK